MENDKEALKASLVSIGEKLRSAREKKKLAIDQVQKQTHIYSTVLIALEEGRCDELLPATYVKSFLKKYSGYLGLDSNALLKEYAASQPFSTDNSSLDIPSQARHSSDIFSRFIYGTSLVLLLIASLSLVTFLSKRTIAFFKRPGKAVLKSVAPSRSKPAAAVKAASLKKPAARVTDLSIDTIPKKEPLNLIIKVKAPVLVGVKRDGVVLFKRVMPKGALESFTANDRIEVYTAKAEAIDLTLNGKSLGSPGKGVIKALEITRKGMRIR